MRRLRGDRLFESVQSLPMTKLDDQPVGDSVYRVMNDTEVIPSIISTVMQRPVSAVDTFAVALVTMLSAYPDSRCCLFSRLAPGRCICW